jgi:hypothetical protein
MKISSVFLALLSIQTQSSLAFVPFAQYKVSHVQNSSRRMTATLQEPSSMRVGELKKELESYGMSTKSYFEKSELVTAVEKARSEGKNPTSRDVTTDTSSSSTSQSSSSTSSKSRDERLAEEIEKCKDMKASELKAELKSYGISTATFFEKSEFVQAVAEARVDGAAKKKQSSEDYAEYTEVEVITDESMGPRKRSDQGTPSQGRGGQNSNPFGGVGGNPFGSGGAGANPFAGMGGNPFGAGANPFAGMGGNPFGGAGAGGMGGMGDQMKKAQEMTSNPNIQKIMAKAQRNPKIMKAVSECMQNPMAFAKYQNDPEVGELIRELQKYM